jgi:hypothetical protein
VQVERHAILERGAADGTRRVDRLNDAKQALAVGDIRALVEAGIAFRTSGAYRF